MIIFGPKTVHEHEEMRKNYTEFDAIVICTHSKTLLIMKYKTYWEIEPLMRE